MLVFNLFTFNYLLLRNYCLQQFLDVVILMTGYDDCVIYIEFCLHGNYDM